jgi:AAA domain
MSDFQEEMTGAWFPPDPPPKPPRTPGNGHKRPPPNAEYVIDKLSLQGWITRIVEPPVFLMGALVSTTSRVELVAPTGLGKTNFALALAAAIAAGRDFLHWKGTGKPARVLYIDGEMPERLMQTRIKDAVSRLDAMPETLFILSREDFPEMPPLNTEQGQQYINDVIEIIGGVDVAFFDNIQALCVGTMKEEDSWQPVLPWIRDLTRRKIGQIWIHHTGLNETHGYGTSTREWQLDTVILLERVQRANADIGFKLSFGKARERTPYNRTDFEPAVITLVDDTWTSERGGDIQSGRSRRAPDRALELLKEAIVRVGEIPPKNEFLPEDRRCVTETTWRDYCAAGFLSEGGSSDPAKKADAERAAFKRACKKLLGCEVGKWHQWVWVIQRS